MFHVTPLWIEDSTVKAVHKLTQTLSCGSVLSRTCVRLKIEPTPVIYVSHTDIVCAAGWCIERRGDFNPFCPLLSSLHTCNYHICARAPPRTLLSLHVFSVKLFFVLWLSLSNLSTNGSRCNRQILIVCRSLTFLWHLSSDSPCPCPAAQPMDQDVTAKYWLFVHLWH